MEQIFIFHLQVFYPFYGTQITTLTDTVDILHNNYHEALIDARKEFKRRHPDIDRIRVIDYNDIHVLDYEFG